MTRINIQVREARMCTDQTQLGAAVPPARCSHSDVQDGSAAIQEVRTKYLRQPRLEPRSHTVKKQSTSRTRGKAERLPLLPPVPSDRIRSAALAEPIPPPHRMPSLIAPSELFGNSMSDGYSKLAACFNRASQYDQRLPPSEVVETYNRNGALDRKAEARVYHPS